MCIHWTHVLYSVVITRQSNPPISQFNSPCNEFTSVRSMFVCNSFLLHTRTITLGQEEALVWFYWVFTPAFINNLRYICLNTFLLQIKLNMIINVKITCPLETSRPEDLNLYINRYVDHNNHMFSLLFLLNCRSRNVWVHYGQTILERERVYLLSHNSALVGRHYKYIT